MNKGLILADDLTGALDTGVELSSGGCKVIVLLEWTADFSAIVDDGIQVAVINTASRHLQPEEAYSRIRVLCEKAKETGLSLIYKKTDSALRGNVGAELSALLDCMKAPILFAPAFPDMRRGMKDGVILIDGMPVAQSVFGKDPFNPVKHSQVQDILQESAGELPVYMHAIGDDIAALVPGVHAMNASTNEELQRIAQNAKRTNITLFAGCAGFARQLPNVWGLHAGQTQIPDLPQRLLVFSGSMNRITIDQLHHGRSLGMYAHTIDESTLAVPALFPYGAVLRALDEGRAAIVEAASSRDSSVLPGMAQIDEQARQEAAQGLGDIATRLIREAGDCLPLIIGGDTLLSVLQKLHCQRLYPVTSVSTGTVLAFADTYLGRIPILTKSGGLGPRNMLETLLACIQTHRGGTKDALRGHSTA